MFSENTCNETSSASAELTRGLDRHTVVGLCLSVGALAIMGICVSLALAQYCCLVLAVRGWG